MYIIHDICTYLNYAYDTYLHSNVHITLTLNIKIHTSNLNLETRNLHPGTRTPEHSAKVLGQPRNTRCASLIRNTPLLGPHSRTIPRVLWWS